MQAKLSAIGHVALVTRDFARLGSFYEDVFGAEVGARSAGDEAAGLGFIHVGDATLHVFERPEGPLGGIEVEHGSRAFERGRIDHVSLEAVDADAFVAVRERLVVLGVSDGTVVDFGPLLSLFFVDPDGFELEVSLRKPERWDPPFEVTPFEASRLAASPAERRPRYAR